MQTYELYKGKITLSFDEKRHIYSIGGKTVYGVTSITNIIAKPQLIYWAVGETVRFLQGVLKAGKSYDEMQIKSILDQASQQHCKSKGEAADMGTMIHDWISSFLKAGLAKKPLPTLPVNEEMRNIVRAFLGWAKEKKVKFISTERKVYSKRYNYAGTLDAEAMIDGKLAVVDFKTGNAIYPEYCLQAVAYLNALKEEEKKRYAGGAYIVRFSKEDKQKNICPFEVMKVGSLKVHLEAFLACHKMYQWQMWQKREDIKANLK